MSACFPYTKVIVPPTRRGTSPRHHVVAGFRTTIAFMTGAIGTSAQIVFGFPTNSLVHASRSMLFHKLNILSSNLGFNAIY